MYDLETILLKREQLTLRLNKALAHLNPEQRIAIITGYISLDVLENIVKAQERYK